jgi:hypothetical protein
MSPLTKKILKTIAVDICYILLHLLILLLTVIAIAIYPMVVGGILLTLLCVILLYVYIQNVIERVKNKY